MTVKWVCGQCQQHNEPTAKFCPGCGEKQPHHEQPEVLPPPPPPAVEAPEPTKTTDTRPWYKKKRWIFGILAGMLVLGGLLGEDTTSGSTSGSGSKGDQSTMAFIMCQDFVKDRLRAPSTAKFPWSGHDGVRISGSGSGPYTVVAYVDAQNGFGAQIRSHFTCNVTNTSDTKWRLNDIAIF